MKVSDCCGASPKNINNDCDTSEFGLCSECLDHCEYIEIEEDEKGSFFFPDILIPTPEHTIFFVEQRGYSHSPEERNCLENGNKRIHIYEDRYEYSEVDESERRLFVKIITMK